MNRYLKLGIILLVASCGGGGGGTPPRNIENACALVRERPAYLQAMRATERRWGVPIHVQMAAIHQESKFVGNARTPHQYALGIIPMGATGAILTVKAMYELERTGGSKALITMCIGGGQGIAVAIERI